MLDHPAVADHADGNALDGKRLRRRGAVIELLPENPEFKPVLVDTRREPLAIEGIAVGVIRNGRMI